MLESLAAFRPALPRLPRPVWILQAGVVVNFFGNGLVGPFLLIYLHFSRGLPIGLAALAVGSGAIVATASGLAAGRLVDRYGARTCAAAAMLCNAIAYAGYTQVHSTWQAFVVALAVGLGTGAYGPAVQSLLTSLVEAADRPAAFAQQRVSAIVGLGAGSAVGGLIAATGPAAFLVLLGLDSATFLAFAALLARLPWVPASGSHDVGGGTGYRAVLRDRGLVAVAAVNLVVVVIGIAPMLYLLPAYAKGQAHVPEAAIGLLYAVNTGTILLIQLPIVRLLAGRRRMRSLGLAVAGWALAWLVILASGQWLSGWTAALPIAIGMFLYAAGECVYSGVVTPTAAGLAPPALRGRYLGVMGFAWQAGFLAGPALGGALLALQPAALPAAAAGACLVAALGIPLVDRVLPPAERLSPAAQRPRQGAIAMKWITRENAAVDRIACPWLIRRFIDPGAEFLFVPADRVRADAAATGAIPFDVEGAELGHVDGRCSFESILVKYQLSDPALARMGAIVHGADIAADEHATAEAAGLKAIAQGFRLLHGADDARKLELEAPLYDALYAYCESPVAKTMG